MKLSNLLAGNLEKILPIHDLKGINPSISAHESSKSSR